MNESGLFKISVIMVLLGLIFLYFYAEEFNSNLVTSLEGTTVEEEVTIRGVVNRVSMQDKVTFLELEGEKVEKTDVVLFNDEDVFIKKGDYVEVSGQVEEYKGKKEVIAHKIVLR